MTANPTSAHQDQPHLAPAPRKRSWFVTGLAWCIIAISAVLTPISFIALLMIMVGSYGTASTTMTGFFNVVILPPTAVVAGAGLFMRHRWAWWAIVSLLTLLAVMHLSEWLTPPTPTTTTTSPSGVKTTVMGSAPNFHSLPIFVVCGACLLRLLMPAIRAEFRPQSQSCRV